jgi:hypothetical protein
MRVDVEGQWFLLHHFEGRARNQIRFKIPVLATTRHPALTELVRKAQAEGLVEAGDPAVLAARYIAVLWGDLLIRLLMRVREAPTAREIEVRARTATETLMALR